MEKQNTVDLAYFKQLVNDFFNKFADFHGRTIRRDFWFTQLLLFIVSITIGLIPFVGTLLYFATLVPGISLTCRRLNDAGKEWYYFFVILIPLIGWLLLLYWLCQPSVAADPCSPAYFNTSSSEARAPAQNENKGSIDLGAEMTREEIKQEKSEFDKALDSANKELDDFLGNCDPDYDDSYENMSSKSSNKSNGFPI